MKQGMNERKGMLLLVVCSLLWSISGVIIKVIPWNAAVIAGFRSLISALVMAAYIKKSGLRFMMSRNSIISSLMMCGMFLCFIAANKLTTAANAIVIQACAPVFVLVYNVLFNRQRIRRLDLITAVLTFVGIAVFFLDQMEGGMLLGNLVALISGVFLAGTYITSYNANEEERMNGILGAHVLTALIGIPFVLFVDTPMSPEAVIGILVLGIVQLGIPYLLFGIAVQYCKPLACSLIGMLEAVFNPIWVFLFTGERPSLLALMGGVLVLVAIANWVVRSQQVETPVPQDAAS